MWPRSGKGTMCALPEAQLGWTHRSTFTAKTLPTLELFKSRDKVVEVDASQSREDVYALVTRSLEAYTDPEQAAPPLTEQSEMRLGLRPYPRRG